MVIANRIIPCLLLKNKGLVKTIRFKNPTYIGDPINAIKIFNEKEVDELIFLDIEASRHRREPPYDLIERIASECFMPFCYGGGIRTREEAVKILAMGAEKVSLNTQALQNPLLIRRIADVVGSQSVVGAIDVGETIFRKKRVYNHVERRLTGKDPLPFAIELCKLGVGEILINSVSRDGMMIGYDIELLRRISSEVPVPTIACGGAGSLLHIHEAVTTGGASAAAAGSLFVFYGKKRGVLINYPAQADIKGIF